MMTAVECRARALNAIAYANDAPNAKLKLDWEIMAQRWARHADEIDIQEPSHRFNPIL